jgi:hypothetical protein
MTGKNWKISDLDYLFVKKGENMNIINKIEKTKTLKTTYKYMIKNNLVAIQIYNFEDNKLTDDYGFFIREKDFNKNKIEKLWDDVKEKGMYFTKNNIENIKKCFEENCEFDDFLPYFDKNIINIINRKNFNPDQVIYFSESNHLFYRLYDMMLINMPLCFNYIENSITEKSCTDIIKCFNILKKINGLKI